MLFVYVNKEENRVVTTSKKRESALYSQADLSEYQVPDDFDMSKEIPSDEVEGEFVRLDGFLNATEFLGRYNADYKAKRVHEYPSTEDQLDSIFHGGIDSWKADIQSIKDKYPKPY